MRIDGQIIGDSRQHFVGGQRRHGQVDGLDGLRQPLHQHAAQHGLAGTDLTSDLHQAFATGNGVYQRLKRFATIRASEEKLRMRGNFERGLIEAEMLKINRHG